MGTIDWRERHARSTGRCTRRSSPSARRTAGSGGGYDWQDDPWLEEYPYEFVEAEDVSALRGFLEHGNWAIRTGIVYDDLAFIQQVNGGDEWWTFKKAPDGWEAFESWTFGGFSSAARIRACRRLHADGDAGGVSPVRLHAPGDGVSSGLGARPDEGHRSHGGGRAVQGVRGEDGRRARGTRLRAPRASWILHGGPPDGPSHPPALPGGGEAAPRSRRPLRARAARGGRPRIEEPVRRGSLRSGLQRLTAPADGRAGADRRGEVGTRVERLRGRLRGSAAVVRECPHGTSAGPGMREWARLDLATVADDPAGLEPARVSRLREVGVESIAVDLDGSRALLFKVSDTAHGATRGSGR